MRVMLVIGTLELGGSERQIALLAQGLVRRGCGVSLFALDGAGPLRAVLADAGVEVLDGGYRVGGGMQGLPRMLGAFVRLLRSIRRMRPDAIHGFLPLTALMAAVAGRWTGVQAVIIARRALGTHQDRHPFWAPMDRLATRLSHAVTANSRAVAADAVRRDDVHPERTHVIYNAVDAGRFRVDPHRTEAARARLGLGPQHVALGCVANLIPYKGHRELIEAFRQVASRFPDARLILIGRDDGIGTQLAGLVRALGLQERVVFLGARDDVAELLGAIDIGALASHEEGFPNALMEMLAAGLPVVATSVGGVPELLDGMPDCWLVPGRDAPALAQALERAIDLLPSARANAGVRRTMVAGRYGIDSMVDAHLALYARIGGRVGEPQP